MNPGCNKELPRSASVLKYTYKIRKTIQAPSNYRTSTAFLPLRFQFNALPQNKFGLSILGKPTRSNKLYITCEIPSVTYVNNSQINLNKLVRVSERESRANQSTWKSKTTSSSA